MASTSSSSDHANGQNSQVDPDVAPAQAVRDNADTPQLFEQQPGARIHPKTPVLIIVMGVSGCGKSTIGQKIADKFRIQFLDGDELHPKSNIDKMSSGTPLTDEDRFPWLRIIRKEAAKETTAESLKAYYDGKKVKDPEQPRAGIVIACSALKKIYRDILRGVTTESGEAKRENTDLDTHFLYLNGSREVLMKRLGSRKGHFFSPSMLDSQLDTLEPPSNEEENTKGIVDVNIDQSVDDVVNESARRLSELTGLKVLD